MKKYRVFDIVWDTMDSYMGYPAETQVVLPKLPLEVVIEVEDDFDPVEEIANHLSDIYGWCIVTSFFEEIER